MKRNRTSSATTRCKFRASRATSRTPSSKSATSRPLEGGRASEQARDVAAARAEAECQAARAAAQAACADVAALKDVLLRPPDPVPVVERAASPSKPRRGFAAWLNEMDRMRS